jgi:branched-chain amino acid transport system ATP-binding protein
MNSSLRLEGLSKSFGGLKAVDKVDLAAGIGEIHSLIGTNGAGKSTLINLIAGEFAPSGGRVYFGELDVTRQGQAWRAKAGLSRSYQRTTVFQELSVHENVRVVAQRLKQEPWSIWRRTSACRVSGEIADRVLETVGLAPFSNMVAGRLSHGAKRQLEIGMCLATSPHILLLDEPLAGMGGEESERVLTLLQRLRPDVAILLVEHDMSAVFRVSDRITVMVNGKVIASGTPEKIRADPEVQLAYLGRE